MKQLILILILASTLLSCSEKNLAHCQPANIKRSKTFSFESKPSIMHSPSTLSSVYYRDANGRLLKEDNITSIQLDSSGVFFRQTQRTKSFPENKIKERLYRDNKASDLQSGNYRN